MPNQVLYGFLNLQDVFAQKVVGVGVNVVNDAINASVAEYNRQLDAIAGLIVAKTTDHQKRFKSAVAARLQPLDDNGRARPIKGQSAYDIAFPMLSAGSAWGVNYVSLQKMTVEDANNASRTMLNADANWYFDHVLAAVFSKDQYTFEDEKWGNLTIKGLANGDGDLYQIKVGGTAQGTADHYLAQAANISDAANPFKAIHKKLVDHPENAGQVVVLVASDLTDEIENLANFKERPDENISVGANNDQLTGRLNVPVPGRIVGYVDKCWIVEWDRLPSGYMIATTTQGDKPIMQREDEEAILRGFNKVAERNDHPFYESQFLRRAGFGANNRVGAVVYQIGNGTYTVPTGYASPMA